MGKARVTTDVLFTYVARKHKETQEAELFYIDEREMLNCWSNRGGHSYAYESYYETETEPMGTEEAQEVFEFYKKNYPNEEKVHITLSTSLSVVRVLDLNPDRVLSFASRVWDLCYTLAEQDGCGELMDLHKEADRILGMGNYEEGE